jgi:hypothetical protein
MIDRAQIEARLAALVEQRAAHTRHLTELQDALRETARSGAQIDGAIIILQEILASDDTPAHGTNGAAAEEETTHVHSA